MSEDMSVKDMIESLLTASNFMKRDYRHEVIAKDLKIAADKLQQLTAENSRLNKSWDSALTQALKNGLEAQQLTAEIKELKTENKQLSDQLEDY